MHILVTKAHCVVPFHFYLSNIC